MLHLAKMHPSKVLELRFKKENFSYKPGQFLYLNCPFIANHEWHPFTITSAPDEKFISVHINIVGNWTGKLYKLLNPDEKLGIVQQELLTGPDGGPILKIDGPFGAASEDVFKYKVVMLVGAGIGATPFASIIKHIKIQLLKQMEEQREKGHQVSPPIHKKDLNDLVEIHTYLTGAIDVSDWNAIVEGMATIDTEAHTDFITGLKSQTLFGRPNWTAIFQEMIKSLNKMIENLESTLQNNTTEAEECIKQEISILKNKKTLIMKNPSILASNGAQKRGSSAMASNVIGSDEVIKLKKTKAIAYGTHSHNSHAHNSSPQPSAQNFSINQLLTPNNSFTAPLTSYLLDEGDDMPQHEPQSYNIHPGMAYQQHHQQQQHPALQSRDLNEQASNWFNTSQMANNMGYLASAPMFTVGGHAEYPFTLPKLNLPESLSQQLMQGQSYLTPQQAQFQPQHQQQSKVVYVKHPNQYIPQQNHPSMMSHNSNVNSSLRWVMESEKHNRK
eukprot:gene7987-9382_t